MRTEASARGNAFSAASRACQRGAVAGALRTAMRATLELGGSLRTGGLVIRRQAGIPTSGVARVRPDGTAADLRALIGLGCAPADADGIRVPSFETGTWKLLRVGSSTDLMTLVTGGGFSLPGGAMVQVAAGKVSRVQIDAVSGDGGSSSFGRPEGRPVMSGVVVAGV